ncbi:adenylate cyclase [Novosphingobium sp. ZN18A2]|uniref:adenylate cyclase n=1 Tax=Novosphingobium sp. ZN18A2 TaxID=3079861 RepID=UPI0030D488E8
MASTASPAQLFVRESRLYKQVALAIAALMVMAFGLFNALGVTDITAAPHSTWLHGSIMFSWLLLFVVQSYLGTGRNLALHRKVGWFGAGLAAMAVVTAWNTGFTTTMLDRAPPVFYPPYFLGLNLLTPVFFAAFVIAAIAMRKRTDWHRRLMLGAILIVIEPSLGRLTIMSLIAVVGDPAKAIALGAANQWLVPTIEMIAQLAIVGVIALRDRAVRGRVHPAIWVAMAGVALLYASIWTLAALPPFAGYVFALKGSGL